MINIDHNPDRYNKKAFRNSYSAFRSNTIKKVSVLSARKIETPLKQFHCFRIAQTAPITWRNIEKLLSLSANMCFLRLSLDEIRHRPGVTQISDLSIKIMFFDVRSTLLKPEQK